MHTCLINIWVRTHHCDVLVGFCGWVIGWPKNGIIDHQRGTLRMTLVNLRKRSALSFSVISAWVLLWFLCFCMVLLYAMWQPLALYIPLFEASHYSWQQLVLFVFSSVFSVKWCLLSKQYICCSVWTSRTSHTHLLYRLNKCTDNQRERDRGKWGHLDLALGSWAWALGERHWPCLHTPLLSTLASFFFFMLTCLQECFITCD